MTTINTRIKSIELPSEDPSAAPSAPAQNPENNELLVDLQATDAQIDQFREENGEWLSEANLQEMERIQLMVKAEIAAIQGYGVGGAYGPGGVDPTMWELPQELDPLWNGVPEDHINMFPEDATRISEDPTRYGEYVGTVEIPNSGDPTMPTNVGFQMTEDMTAVYGESRGRDIILTAVYEDGRRESWVVRDGSVRTEPMIISALGLSHGVTIDLHRVYRHGGQPLYIHGTEHNDTIHGTQGADGIVAYAGDDVIKAWGGDDRVYGDEHYEYAGQFDPGYGGHDTIQGGAGNDIMYGGGGLDTQFTSDVNESINEFERSQDDVSAAPPSPSAWMNSDEWQLTADGEDGMLLFRNESPDGKGGVININMAGMSGYDMAFGDMDADGSLIITFVGEEGSFKVKFEDFFNEQFGAENPADRIVRLNIMGSDGNEILHFADVEVTSQVINLYGGSGEDIILGTRNKMLSDGLDLNNLTQSQKNGAGVLQGYVNEGIFAADEEHQYNESGDLTEWCGYKSTVENGQIVIRDDGDSSTEREPILSLKAPDGYTHGYITSDASGNTYVILVKPTASDKAKTLVIKIEASLGLGYNEILVKNEVALRNGEAEYSDLGAPFTLTAISMGNTDYEINGGTGEDLVFAPEGTKVRDDQSEIVWQPVERTLPTPSMYGNTSGAEDPINSGEEADIPVEEEGSEEGGEES